MADSIKIQTLKTTATLMTTAFAFIAGLAWNGAISALIGEFFDKGSATTGLVIYAILITIIAVLATVLIGRSLGKMGVEVDEE